MKWTENGVTFEGPVAEYKELHADGFAPQLQRTRMGKRVTVIDGDNQRQFPSIKEAAEYIGQQTGRYVSASTLGRVIDEDGSVSLEKFKGASLFDTNTPQPNNQEGENENAE